MSSFSWIFGLGRLRGRSGGRPRVLDEQQPAGKQCANGAGSRKDSEKLGGPSMTSHVRTMLFAAATLAVAALPAAAEDTVKLAYIDPLSGGGGSIGEGGL